MDFQIVWRGTNGNNIWVGRAGKPVLGICDHIMQGTEEGTDSVFHNASWDASAHFGVARDGRIWQWVNENDTAWAEGIVNQPDRSISWLDKIIDAGDNPNYYFISIEHEGNSGVPLTEIQYQATLWLHRRLIQKYNIVVDRQHIIGHYQIDDVNRAHCPGPAFPWARLMADLQSGQTNNNQPVVSKAQPQGDSKVMKSVDGSDIWVVYPITVAYQQWPWLGLPLNSMASLADRGLPGDGVTQDFERGRVEIRKGADGNYRDPELGVVNSELFKALGKL